MNIENHNYNLGKQGEDLASEFLVKKAYRILHTNYRKGRTEIDIIAENNEYLVFVEVKTRRFSVLCMPEYAVNREKQRHIIKTAQGYVRYYKIEKEVRFDIIGIIYTEEGLIIDHIKNAFYPMMR